MEKGPSQNFIKKEEHKEISQMIEELRIPTQIIFEEIKNSINKGEYKTIIGDDGSGRIPTLIFNNVISNIYKDKGFIKPNILFSDINFKGGTNEEYVDFYKKYISTNLREELMKESGKCLIVTDTIASGNTLRFFTEFLKENKIDYEIASLSVDALYLSDNIDENYNLIPEKIEKDWDLGEFNKIHFGSLVRVHGINQNIKNIKTEKPKIEKDTLDIYSERFQSKIYGNPDSSGINKEFNKKVERTDEYLIKNENGIKTYKPYYIESKKLPYYKYYDERRIPEARENVKIVRKDIKILSDQLIEWYRNNLENK